MHQLELQPDLSIESVADLQAAGTTGFSIFPAEVGVSEQDWQAYGTGIARLGIATPAR
jgi:hypothetical protein